MAAISLATNLFHLFANNIAEMSHVCSSLQEIVLSMDSLRKFQQIVDPDFDLDEVVS